jgi:hypothetical protein
MNTVFEQKLSNLKRYPIHMCASERNALCEIISDRRNDFPNVWKQLMDEQSSDSYIIFINAYEQGFVVSSIAKQRSRMPDIWKQLMELISKFRKDAGVEIIDLGNNMIQLIDDEGVSIVRQKFEWEI